MDTNSLSQSLDSVNTAVSVAGEEEVSRLSAIKTLLYFVIFIIILYDFYITCTNILSPDSYKNPKWSVGSQESLESWWSLPSTSFFLKLPESSLPE